MNDTARRSVEDVARAVAQADGSALLVPSRILRRVIKAHRELGGLGLRVPHPSLHLIDRDALLKIATPAELDLPEGAALPERLILLARPYESRLRKDGAAVVLRDCWRLLFHAHAHGAIAKARAAARWTPPGCARGSGGSARSPSRRRARCCARTTPCSTPTTTPRSTGSSPASGWS